MITALVNIVRIWPDDHCSGEYLIPIALVNVCMPEPGFLLGLLWGVPQPTLLFASQC